MSPSSLGLTVSGGGGSSDILEVSGKLSGLSPDDTTNMLAKDVLPMNGGTTAGLMSLLQQIPPYESVVHPDEAGAFAAAHDQTQGLMVGV